MSHQNQSGIHELQNIHLNFILQIFLDFNDDNLQYFRGMFQR